MNDDKLHEGKFNSEWLLTESSFYAGDTIDGSDGDPWSEAGSFTYLDAEWTHSNAVYDLIFSYGAVGMNLADPGYAYNCQFNDCYHGIEVNWGEAHVNDMQFNGSLTALKFITGGEPN